MANTSNVRVLWYDPAFAVSVPSHATTSRVVAIGDFVTLESNVFDVMDAVGDDSLFAGIAISANASGDLNAVTVASVCKIRVAVASASYGLYDGLKYSLGDNGTDWVLIADGGANTIAWSMQETGTVTTLDVLIHVPLLAINSGKLFTTPTT